jgi:hypothetical protein
MPARAVGEDELGEVGEMPDEHLTALATSAGNPAIYANSVSGTT